MYSTSVSLKIHIFGSLFPKPLFLGVVYFIKKFYVVKLNDIEKCVIKIFDSLLLLTPIVNKVCLHLSQETTRSKKKREKKREEKRKGEEKKKERENKLF